MEVKVKAAITVNYDYDQAIMADHAFESDKPTHSQLLGPNGAPLAYQRQKIGFDLTPKVRG